MKSISSFFGYVDKRNNELKELDRLKKEQERVLEWCRVYDGDHNKDLEKILSRKIENIKKQLTTCIAQDLIYLQAQHAVYQSLLDEYLTAWKRAVEIESKIKEIKNGEV